MSANNNELISISHKVELKPNNKAKTHFKKALTQEENFEFIYSCPCKIDHRLSFKEHESITNEGKVMRCKKCQELLFFIRSQEKTYKG